MIKKVLFLSLSICQFAWGALVLPTGQTVLYTNTPGEYYDILNSSMLRMINVSVQLLDGVVTLEISSPALPKGYPAIITQFGLENIVVTPVLVKKTIAQVKTEGHISGNIALTTNGNAGATSGYQVALTLLFAALDLNVSTSQYFQLQMPPLPSTKNTTGLVYFDILYGGVSTDKWLLPPQGLFLTQTWKTNQIMTVPPNPASITFSLQVPYTSFVGLPEGKYWITLNAVMTQEESAADTLTATIEAVAAQLNNLQLQLSIAQGTTPKTPTILANQAYLEVLIAEVIGESLL